VTVPPAATARMLAMEFARFLGLQFAGRVNLTDIVDAVCVTAARTRVELVCVDELHNLNLATRAGAEVSDQLKYFAERLPATFAYAGIDVESAGLFAGTRARQIAGRFTVIPATPFAAAAATPASGKRADAAPGRRPARHETLASYLARLAGLHGLDPGELWHQVSTPQPGTRRRAINPGQLAAITGRPAGHLTRALPELRRPEPDWQAWRHQPQPGCPRCDARHDGGPVTRLLPHHRYVCTRHRYWIGPPDAGQPATPLGPGHAGIVQAQRRHLRLLRRHGPAATYDAVLTGFLLCGHLWTDWPGE
jgi:hypothetical protein